MSDKVRWRYSDTNPVVAAVAEATVIEIGDLLYQDGDDAKPASLLHLTSEYEERNGVKALQVKFAELFLGVAMQRSRSGDTDQVRVATLGVFEFDCPAGTFKLGDLIGVNEASSGTELENQQVVKVTSSKYAIARVAKRLPIAATSVLVDIRSTIMTGGILVRLWREY